MMYGVQGGAAPELRVPNWIDESGQARPPLTLQELGARYRVLFFYQHWCSGCHSRGFPTLLALVAAKKAVDVGFAVVQTVFEGVEVNTLDQLVQDQSRYGLRIPFGHDAISADGRYPTTMIDYRTGGTPWFVVIDPAGTVIENGFTLDAEQLLSAI